MPSSFVYNLIFTISIIFSVWRWRDPTHSIPSWAVVNGYLKWKTKNPAMSDNILSLNILFLNLRDKTFHFCWKVWHLPNKELWDRILFWFLYLRSEWLDGLNIISPSQHILDRPKNCWEKNMELKVENEWEILMV